MSVRVQEHSTIAVPMQRASSTPGEVGRALFVALAALGAGAPDAGESGGGAKGATPCPAPLRPASHHFAALFFNQIIPASFLICFQTVVYSRE
ncbi:unnamed protein product [Euphydryas editha]|uniref:Uncharacterized protein n=1 Tax=Euphydryas editha TaxID=104508 RepID=A0AAU9UAY0_EUPED|nr:unnamed protein product [Euphydryas editha]